MTPVSALDLFNILFVKLEIKFLAKMCPKPCKSSKKSLKTRQQWQGSKTLHKLEISLKKSIHNPYFKLFQTHLKAVKKLK